MERGLSAEAACRQHGRHLTAPGQQCLGSSGAGSTATVSLGQQFMAPEGCFEGSGNTQKGRWVRRNGLELDCLWWSMSSG